jgi:hypothetical protein
MKLFHTVEQGKGGKIAKMIKIGLNGPLKEWFEKATTLPTDSEIKREVGVTNYNVEDVQLVGHPFLDFLTLIDFARGKLNRQSAQRWDRLCGARKKEKIKTWS